MRFPRPIRFQPRCVERIGSHSSGCPKPHLRWLTRIGGWTGVVALAAAAIAAAFGLLTRFLLREWQPNAVLIAVLCAVLLTAPHILARPHILALPVMVGMDYDADPRGRYASVLRRWLLLPLMTLWANLHGSFTFGLAMIAPIACDALWRAPHAERLSVVRQWAFFALLALGAACLNPYGPEAILVTFRTIALGGALTTVTEWRSQDFTHLGGFEIVMLAAFGFALYRGVTLPLLRIVMVLGVLHLSLSQVRHADLLGMLAPIFLARPLAEQFTTMAANRMQTTLRRSMAASRNLALLIAVTGLASLRNDIFPPTRITPTEAIHSIDIDQSWSDSQ